MMTGLNVQNQMVTDLGFLKSDDDWFEFSESADDGSELSESDGDCFGIFRIR